MENLLTLRIFLLTFLHLASAIIVQRFPGIPSSINRTQQTDAKYSKTGEMPLNKFSYGCSGNKFKSLEFNCYDNLSLDMKSS